MISKYTVVIYFTTPYSAGMETRVFSVKAGSEEDARLWADKQSMNLPNDAKIIKVIVGQRPTSNAVRRRTQPGDGHED